MALANITQSKNSEFLGYLHSFRGLAILKIVFGHAVAAACIGVYGVFDVSNPILMISEVFYHDSTLYFAIISGILFSQVLKPRGYFKFYKSKLKHIVLPYLFFTVVLTLIKINFRQFSNFQDGLQWTVSKIWMNFIFGKANFALWYIPILIALFLVTPVLEFLQKRNSITKICFFIMMILPLFISRVQNLTAYHVSVETIIYFTGAYAFGMYLGEDLNDKLKWLKTYQFQITLLGYISSAWLFYLYIYDLDAVGMLSLKETVFYIQKISFAIIFILWFKTFQDKQPHWLIPIASDSFSIYFIHGSLLYKLLPWVMSILKPITLQSLKVVLGAFILGSLVMVLSMLMVAISKKLFGKYSRMIVGA